MFKAVDGVGKSDLLQIIVGEMRQGDHQTALNNLMAAIKVAPNFKPAYELSAQIYEAQGDVRAAQEFRATAAQIK